MGILKDGAELLMDFWRHIRQRSSLALLQSTVARVKGSTVDQWYPPINAAEKFGVPGKVRFLEEAKQERQKVWDEIREHLRGYRLALDRTEARERFRELHRQFKRTNREANERIKFIYVDLNAQLANGELTARGFREPFSHGAPYLTISQHEWRIIKLEPPDRAVGAGVSYAGVTIGKVGTKSFFRRH